MEKQPKINVEADLHVSPEKTKEQQLYFCIAAHIVEVVLPAALDWKRFIPSFKTFKVDTAAEQKMICSVRVVDHAFHFEPDTAKLLYEVSGIFGHFFCLFETEHNYITNVQFVEDGVHYQMISDKSFTNSTVYIDLNDRCAGLIFSSFVMTAFAQSVVLHQTLLIHASVVEKEGYGYAFLGKSGTGKSTHSALWLRHIEGTTLLNDDNPAVRVEDDGSVNVYGTPWSGKTPCYKNRKAALKVLVRLEQADTNRFTWKEGVNALITFLPSCSSMRWNALLYNEMCNCLEKVVDRVRIACLACLPNKEAVQLCYEEINNENKLLN